MRLLIAFLLAGALAMPCFGAQSRVQAGPANCNFISGDLTCTFSSGVTGGGANVVVVGIGVRLNTATAITSVSGTAASFSLVKGHSQASTGEWLYCGVATSGDTVTVVLNGTYYYGWITMAEYANTTCTDAGTVGNSGPSDAQACGTFTPSQAHSVVAAAAYYNDTTDALTAPSGYNTAVDGYDATRRNAMLADRVLTSASEQVVTFGPSAVAAWSCVAAALTEYTPPAGFSRVTTGRSVTSGRVN